MNELLSKLSIFALYLIDYKYVKKKNNQVRIDWFYRRKKKEKSHFMRKQLSNKEFQPNPKK